jgi:hypothetical protein
VLQEYGGYRFTNPEELTGEILLPVELATSTAKIAQFGTISHHTGLSLGTRIERTVQRVPNICFLVVTAFFIIRAAIMGSRSSFVGEDKMEMDVIRQLRLIGD